MKIQKYIVGSEKNEVYNAISNSVPKDNEYLHFRLNGGVKDLCNDTFYAAHKDGKVLSRLWMGYPKHKNSIGNWGCVYTDEECRGQGLARKTLDYWYEDIQKSDNLPLGLFCTTGKAWVTQMYTKYGFATVLEGAEYGPLYMPLGDSPKTFKGFCEMYYTPTKALHTVKATFEWRNEIDCLLKFAMIDMGLNYTIDGQGDLYNLLRETPEREIFAILTEEDKCVGWMLDGKICIYPPYADLINTL